MDGLSCHRLGQLQYAQNLDNFLKTRPTTFTEVTKLRNMLE